MANNKVASMTTTLNIGDVSLTSTKVPHDDKDPFIKTDNTITNFVLAIFPLYTCAILLNFLSIYSILMAKVYRQYLSNILLSVICIGALINLHGEIFLILLRWTNDASLGSALCSTSTYLRDCGSIIIYMHILLLSFERILANLKKQPANLNKPLFQKAHFFIITISLISIILSFTVPIYTLKTTTFATKNGLCTPFYINSYKKYILWIYYGFGYPFVWMGCLLLSLFLLRKATTSYSSLIPMNKIILIIGLSSCASLFIQTLFDDILGIKSKSVADRTNNSLRDIFFFMNLRDFISIIDKILIGLVFFLFRPEIRLWILESMKKFQSNKNEAVTPQMLDIRTELDDNFNETDDGNIHFPADT